VAKQRQRVERVLADVHHAYAAALTHRIMNPARGLIRFSQHHDEHVRAKIFGQQARRHNPKGRCER